MADNDEIPENLKQKVQDFQHVFGSDAGQRVLRHLEEFCGLQSDGFAPDPYINAYNAGRRSVGVFILNWLEMSRSEFQDMVRQQVANSD
jgi:hypothetical protein